MHPHVVKAAPVRLEIALGVTPKPARHAGPRVAEHQLADLTSHRPPVGIHDVRGHPRQRSGERACAQVCDHVAAQDPAGDLGPARVVDDRDAPATDRPEEPVEGLRVPGLAGAAEDAQAGEVVLRRWPVAVRHQRAHEGGGDAEDGDAMVLDHAPQPIRPGMVRRAFVKDHRRAEHQRSQDQPGAHHPAQVREPEDRVRRAHVEPVGHVLGGLHREPAVHVQRALRLAGGARRVDDHQRVLGIQLMGRGVVGLVLEQHLPHQVARMVPRDLSHHAPVHDHLPHARARQQGAVRGLLHGHHLAAAVEAVSADQQLGLAVP